MNLLCIIVRISAIAAMSITELLCYKLYRGSMKFVQGLLITTIYRTKTLIKFLSCIIHHALRDMGIPVLYLPPYSPDMNPIEEMFSYISYYLKDHDVVLQAMNDQIPLIEASFDSVTPDKCVQ